MRTFDRFYDLVPATTVPTTEGRRVLGTEHAVALSEATDRLYVELANTFGQLLAQHGSPAAAGPPGLTLVESDSPDGPWQEIPPGSVRITMLPIGGDADAVLQAALTSARQVVAFPPDKWNAMQARRPGGPHQRWHAGDVITTRELDILECASGLLKFKLNERRPDGDSQSVETSPPVEYRFTEAVQLILKKAPDKSEGAAEQIIIRARKKGRIRENGREGTALRLDAGDVAAVAFAEEQKYLARQDEMVANRGI